MKKFRIEILQIAVGIEMVKIPAINPPCLSFLRVLLHIGPIKVNQKWPFSGWKFENLDSKPRFENPDSRLLSQRATIN